MHLLDLAGKTGPVAPDTVMSGTFCKTCLNQQTRETLAKAPASASPTLLSEEALERTLLNGASWGPDGMRAPSESVQAALGFFACRPSSRVVTGDNHVVASGIEQFYLSNPVLIVKQAISFWKEKEFRGKLNIYLRRAGHHVPFAIRDVPIKELLQTFPRYCTEGSFFIKMTRVFCKDISEDELDDMVEFCDSLIEPNSSEGDGSKGGGSKDGSSDCIDVEIPVSENAHLLFHRFSMLQTLALSFPVLFKRFNERDIFKVF